MTDKPIPFTRAMALATWRGDKTETRRVLSIRGHKSFSDFYWTETPGYDWTFRDSELRWHDLRHGELLDRLPYKVGNRLWVREPYWQRGHWAPAAHETTKGGAVKWRFVPLDLPATGAPVFDPPASFRLGMRRDGTAGRVDWYQRLARFMPRAYSRQPLVVRDVRVERLHDIDDAGALAEGITHVHDGRYGVIRDGELLFGASSPRRGYQRIWESINGPKSWDANPWVVVVRYTKLGAAE